METTAFGVSLDVRHSENHSSLAQREVQLCRSSGKRYCDMRSAVMGVNVAWATAHIFTFLRVQAALNDAINTGVDDFSLPPRVLLLHGQIELVVTLTAAVLGIVGTMRYNAHLVAVSGAVVLLSILWAALQPNPLDSGFYVFLLGCALLFCPHWIFISEIRRGVVRQSWFEDNGQESSFSV